MGKETLFALIVSLLTWIGVWIYLFRLDRATRQLEKTLRDVPREEL